MNGKTFEWKKFRRLKYILDPLQNIFQISFFSQKENFYPDKDPNVLADLVGRIHDFSGRLTKPKILQILHGIANTIKWRENERIPQTVFVFINAIHHKKK